MTESGQSADTLRPPTTRIVDSVDDITADWLTEALHQAGCLDQGRVASLGSELMSVGQLGLVARLTLSYDGAGPDVPPTAMVKLPSKDAGSRAVGVALGIYESEVRFTKRSRRPSASGCRGCIGPTWNRRPAASHFSSRI